MVFATIKKMLLIVLIFFISIAHATTNNDIFVTAFPLYVENKINYVTLAATNEPKTNGTKNVQSKQARKSLNTGGTGELSFFFLVGIFVNLAMISAYFIWAIRQWKKE